MRTGNCEGVAKARASNGMLGNYRFRGWEGIGIGCIEEFLPEVKVVKGRLICVCGELRAANEESFGKEVIRFSDGKGGAFIGCDVKMRNLI